MYCNIKLNGYYLSKHVLVLLYLITILPNNNCIKVCVDCNVYTSI